jgi:hypothetical protein
VQNPSPILSKGTLVALSDNGLDLDTYIDGLRAELANAKAAGYDTVKGIEAELKRVSSPAKETAAKAAPETPEG